LYLWFQRVAGSGRSIGGWQIRLIRRISVLHLIRIGRIVGLAFGFAFEFFFFFALFGELFLAFFVGVIRSCHRVLS